MLLRSLCVLLVTVWIIEGAAEAQDPLRPTPRPQLAGRWQLNEALSEPLPALPGDAIARARASGVLPTVSLRRRGRKGLDLHQALKVRAAVRNVFEATTHLAFARRDTAIVMTDVHGRSLALVPDGRTVSVELPDVPFDVLAHWEASSLIVERRYADGTVLTDRYATFAEPRQLAVTTTVVNQRIDEPPVTVLRVFDPLN